MKRKLCIVFGTIVICLLSACTPAIPDATPTSAPELTAQDYRNQVGFGFYRMGSTLDDVLENMENEAAYDYINTWITPMASYNFNDALAVLRKAKEFGSNQMTWLNIGETVFLYQSSGAQFNSEWQSSLASMMDTIRQEGLIDNVLGFYFDEPMLCGIKKSDFRDATKHLHETYPELRVMAVFAVNAIDPNIWSNDGNDQVLDADTTQYLTDAGYDLYSDVRGSSNLDIYRSLNETLKQQLGRNDVRIWYIPCVMNYRGNTNQAYALAHLNAMYSFLNAEENPGGLLCYAYDITNHDGIGNIGYNEMKNDLSTPWHTLETKLRQIGKELTSK